ncbi:hypothetical protein [Streptomyces sp. NPDC005573]|uniref:hypothetical protein n=1 Tax=Streptomyces sp. NPDC005573 TaxID=3156890 RepID=UPI0033B08075
MTVDEVIQAAGPFGPAEVGDAGRDHAVFSPARKVEIHRRAAASPPPAVTA